MEYFWKQQDDIPSGMGYPLFGTTHLVSVALTMACVLVAALVVSRKSETVQKKVLKFIPLFMVGMEVFKDLFLVHVGRFGIGYLPLHVCSIGIFVFLLRQYLPWKWSKDYFGEISFVLIMPASIAALIFADWPVPDSPLSWLSSFMGNPGYLAGYAILVVGVMLLIYLFIEIFRGSRIQ